MAEEFTPILTGSATVLVVPKGATSVADVRLGKQTDSLVEAADVILTEDGRLLRSRWTTRAW